MCKLVRALERARHVGIWDHPALKWLVTIVALALAVGRIASASHAVAQGSYEPTSELPGGTLSFAANGSIAIDREDIVIGIDKVRLTYVLRNLTGREHAMPMAFVLPDIDMLELDGASVALPAYDSQNPTNFLGFWTMIDGKPVAPEVNVRALVLGTIDISRNLTGAGLPLYPLSPDMADRIAQLPPATRTDFVRRGILNGMIDPPAPAWTLRTGFHWPLVVAPDRSTTVQHGYRPVLGSDVWSEENAADLTARFCLTPDVVQRLDAKRKAGDQTVVYWMTYEPGAKSHLRGVSANLNLTIEKPSDQGIVSTCFKGMKQTPSAIEWSARDQLLSEDLHILFVE